jgi:cyanophycinase-like exopeptidase
MKAAFLFGGMTETFEACSAEFVRTAGGRSAVIALLLMGGENWERHVPRYRDPWRRLGAADVVPIVPAAGATALSTDAIASLRRCTGIFIGGGDTRVYHRLFTASEVRGAIRHMYAAGIPFGGVSAGALIATESCVVWGSRAATATNEWLLRAKSHADPAGDGDVQLALGTGLGSGTAPGLHRRDALCRVRGLPPAGAGHGADGSDPWLRD